MLVSAYATRQSEVVQLASSALEPFRNESKQVSQTEGPVKSSGVANTNKRLAVGSRVEISSSHALTHQRLVGTRCTVVGHSPGSQGWHQVELPSGEIANCRFSALTMVMGPHEWMRQPVQVAVPTQPTIKDSLDSTEAMSKPTALMGMYAAIEDDLVTDTAKQTAPADLQRLVSPQRSSEIVVPADLSIVEPGAALTMSVDAPQGVRTRESISSSRGVGAEHEKETAGQEQPVTTDKDRANSIMAQSLIFDQVDGMTALQMRSLLWKKYKWHMSSSARNDVLR